MFCPEVEPLWRLHRRVVPDSQFGSVDLCDLAALSRNAMLDRIDACCIILT